MSDFILYLKQRFNPGIFSLLTLFLLLFSKSELLFGMEDVYNFILLFFFLLIMRLYDDLQNSVTDREKKNRIYTESKSRKKLSYILIILITLFLSILSFYKIEPALIVALFLGTNHILYLLLYNYRNFKNYLPLLKYPLIFIVLNGQFNAASTALFLAMLVFEILDDIDFSIWKKYSNAIAAIAILLLIPNLQAPNLALLLVILAVTTFMITKNLKITPYLFLLLFLLTRLTIISHEI